MFLNPSELFKSKQTEMMENVKVSLETCNAFLKSYSECQEKHDQDIKNYPWEFPDKRVFSHFENFLDKLNKIYVSLIKFLNIVFVNVYIVIEQHFLTFPLQTSIGLQRENLLLVRNKLDTPFLMIFLYVRTKKYL